MKLPNGYGSITKLTGKRRKPWIVRIGADHYIDKDSGKYVTTRKILGYYATRAEALTALSDYNGKPYNLDMANLTFSELYELWSAEHYKHIVPSSVINYRTAYKHCAPLHKLTFRDLRTAALQQCINDSGMAYASQKKMLTLLNLMYKYALANDSADKNYAAYVRIADPEIQNEHIPFTDQEISQLKKLAKKEPYADTILIMIYTGWRITELLTLRRDDVDLEALTMKGGSKTEAGKNRIIPIHPCIEKYVRRYYDMENETLIPKMSYTYYCSKYFSPICEKISTVHHRTHDCRHTFATRADNVGMNKVCIQRLMGHASKNVTDQVYTHKDVEELRKAILLLP